MNSRQQSSTSRRALSQLRPFDLRRPQRRDGCPRDRLGNALFEANVQEAEDFALIAQAATLEYADSLPALF